jgi:hypothetical protein
MLSVCIGTIHLAPMMHTLNIDRDSEPTPMLPQDICTSGCPDGRRGRAGDLTKKLTSVSFSTILSLGGKTLAQACRLC